MSDKNYDVHIHTDFSDGSSSVRAMVERGVKLRLGTIAIVDHFWPSMGARKGGISLVKERRETIELLREEYPQIKILEGVEVDIGSDGSLAPVAGGLEQFDLVIGSVHWGSDSRHWASAVTGAAERESFDILGHWNGYLTSYRQEHGAMVAETLAMNDIAVELNSRYELRYEEFLSLTRDKGCMFSVGSDSHHESEVGRIQEQLHIANALDLPLLDF
ncbi:MAG: PHP domain-containing protein [Candidatus Thorarchaeota archaeon]